MASVNKKDKKQKKFNIFNAFSLIFIVVFSWFSQETYKFYTKHKAIASQVDKVKYIYIYLCIINNIRNKNSFYYISIKYPFINNIFIYLFIYLFINFVYISIYCYYYILYIIKKIF